MKKHFFITGLPRMKSAWLANFLTYGKTHCHHDIFTYVATLEGFQLAMDWDYEVVGVADPALVFFWEDIRLLYPEAPWIVIERPFDETADSCRKAFSEEFDEASLHAAKANLEALKVRLKPRVFNFQHLAVQEIASLCSTEIPYDRVAMLTRMQVQLEPKYLLTKIQELKNYPTPLMRSIA